MLDWEKIVRKDVMSQLSSFAAGGIIPTLRTMHYRLYSLQTIPNTKSAYTTLSDRTARAREDGRLPIDCFADDTRYIVGEFDTEFDYQTPESSIDSFINYLKNFSKNYSIPRWYKQPNYVEIWTEKKAMIRTFESILGDREVLIVPFGGYTSITYHNDNCKRLKKFQELGKKVHILYFGDVDPSGEDIQRDIERKLSKYLIYDVDFKRIAVTEKQIAKFNLPRDPDAKTLDKLKNDTRSDGFKSNHNGELFQVEVDALTAYVPEEFKNMVLGPVDQYFDNDIYKKLLLEHSPEQLHRLVNKRMKFIDYSQHST